MDFYLEFHKKSRFTYCLIDYNDDIFISEQDETVGKIAEITDNNGKFIGYLAGYIFDNDNNFYDNCDAISGDCERIDSVKYFV